MEIRIRCPQCRATLPMDARELLSRSEVFCDSCGAELCVGVDFDTLAESGLGAALRADHGDRL